MLYLGIERDAIGAAKRELGARAAALAASAAHRLSIEATRAQILAGDSDVVLATRSVLFSGSALDRMESFLQSSAWVNEVLVVDSGGQVFLRTPSVSAPSHPFVGHPYLKSLLAVAEADSSGVGSQNGRGQFLLGGPNTSDSESIAFAVPIASFGGVNRLLLLVSDVSRIESLLRDQAAPSEQIDIAVAPAPMDDAASVPPQDALNFESQDEIGASAAIGSVTLPALERQLLVQVTEQRATRFAGVQEQLRSTVVLVALLVAGLGVCAYLLSVFFVRPLRSLAAFVTHEGGSESLQMIPQALGRFSELQSIAQEVLRQRIMIQDQFDLLAVSIRSLEQSNARLQGLSADVRAVASAADFGELLGCVRKALAGIGAGASLIYIRDPSSGKFARASGPEELPLSLGEQAVLQLGEHGKARSWNPYYDKHGNLSLVAESGNLLHSQVQGAADDDHILDAICNAVRITLDNMILLVRVRTEERERALSQNAQVEAELMNLKNQLNPHFLFNALNSIVYLIEEDPPRSIEAVSRLAHLYRRIMQASSTPLVLIGEELEIVTLYLETEKMRFTSRLRYSIHCQPEAKEVQVPSLMLQTLVENAIKHGIAKSVDGGEISIMVALTQEDAVIEVINTGAQFNDGARGLGTGVGLANTRRRLKLLYGDAATFSIGFVEDKGTLARVNFPARRHT
jgi:HAMP domain-containing protein